MRVRHITAAVLTTALLLSGCSSLSLSGPDILTPPKAAGHRAEVQRVIEEDAGGAYALIYPASGSYKSGILLHDINGDGIDDAVALYTAADGSPRLLIAKEQDGGFCLAGSTQLRSPNVSGVRFADVNADGTEELLISFDAGTAYTSLSVYFPSEEITGLTVAEGFGDYVTGDFDGNSADDILLLTAGGDEHAAATLMVYGDNSFSEKSSCAIDPEVLSYADPRFDNISAEVQGAVLDGVLADGSYTTQLIYYDSTEHMLVNPLLSGSGYEDSTRTAGIASADIDGDGVVEFPICTPTAYNEDENASDVCDAVRWCCFDFELMAPVAAVEGVLCDRIGCMLCFDSERMRALTARYTAENAVTLYELSYVGNDPVKGHELLTVKRYSKNGFDSSLTAEAKLYESSLYTYTYILSEGSPFTHDDIENSFLILETE